LTLSLADGASLKRQNLAAQLARGSLTDYKRDQDHQLAKTDCARA
jgi:hypothetical protein